MPSRSAPPAVYGNDRVFAYLRLAADQDAEQERAVAALEAAGQPVVRITVSDVMQLGQEFFRWEMATAVAGSIIGINPFDQPDVEAAKVKTRDLTTAYEKAGALPEERAFFEGEGIKLFADPRNEAALKPQATSLAAALKAHFGRIGAGRLRGAARLYRAQPRPYRGDAAAPPHDPRPDQGGDLRRLRAALPAFDGTGL